VKGQINHDPKPRFGGRFGLEADLIGLNDALGPFAHPKRGNTPLSFPFISPYNHNRDWWILRSSWGLITPSLAAGISREWCLLGFTVGEALTHVQGESLKVNAVVQRRLINSPAASGILWWPFSFFGLARHPAGARSRTGARLCRLACAATQGRIRGEPPMGYYEQIGEANREYRRRRAAMHPLRRRLGDVFWKTIIYGASLLLWLVMLSPVWLWAVL
jgi:hypothetical protein